MTPTPTPIAATLASMLDPDPIAVTDPDGRTFVLFDGIQIGPHPEGGIVVTFGYGAKAHSMVHFPELNLFNAEQPEALIATITGLDGRMEIKTVDASNDEAAHG